MSNENIVEKQTGSKPSKLEKKSNLLLSDCTCPICFEVFIEPIQLKCCNYELCLKCLNDIKVLGKCPICSIVLPELEDSKKLINWARWNEIQASFAKEIRIRREERTAQLVADSIANFKLFYT
jgi:hypothetical protein